MVLVEYFVVGLGRKIRVIGACISDFANMHWLYKDFKFGHVTTSYLVIPNCSIRITPADSMEASGTILNTPFHQSIYVVFNISYFYRIREFYFDNFFIDIFIIIGLIQVIINR